MRRLVLLLLLLACTGVVLAAAYEGPPPRAGGRIRVVAAEDVWGSIAAQLGGARARVTSVIASPAVDPHDYEPTAPDARALAAAQLVIVNGAGYDAWASRLVAANPVRGRVVIDVGKLVGVARGENPHRWYSPRDVALVTRAIARAYARLEPRHAALFARRRAAFERHGLSEYHALIAEIRRRYRRVPVGASESIVEPLLPALGLRLVTPPAFLRAISEGAEPSAQDTATVDRQLALGRVAVWLLNEQNDTPDISRITSLARRAGVPVVTVAETPTPATASFQAWQSRQLRAFAAALHTATGR